MFIIISRNVVICILEYSVQNGNVVGAAMYIENQCALIVLAKYLHS